MAKATFSLPDETLETLRRTATRLRKPQSQVVREAVAEYAQRADRLSETERLQMLNVLEELRVSRRGRSARAVDQEITGIRDARRRGGRRA
jgi:predicted DNA-binding protein